MMNTTKQNPWKQRRRAAGLTLIELLASMAVASILIVAIGSAMLLASRALPSKTSLASQTLATTRSIDLVLAELRFALHFTERTDKSVQFSIPDRTGDGKPEVVRYAWSGTAGHPLTRTFNGVTTTALEKVNTFAFTWDTVTSAETFPGPPVESAEQVLISHFPAAGTYTSDNADVDNSHAPGQYFVPTLPADAISWKVTQVTVRAKQKGLALSTANFRLRTAGTDGLPTSTIIDSTAMLELTMNASMANLNVNFNNAGGLTPGAGVCLTIESAGGDAAVIEYCKNTGSNMLDGNGIGSFTSRPTDSLRYVVRGTVTAPTTRSVNRTRVVAAQINATTTVEPTNQLHSAVALLNEPEVLAAYWEANFTVDPTAIDLNAGGQNDWRASAAFNVGTLVSGRWNADQALVTNPADNFNQFTAIEVRMEDTTATGGGSGLGLIVDRNALLCGVIEATVQRKANNKQDLKILTRDLLILPVTLATVTDLPAGPVSLNLYVKPSNDTFVCVVNGVFQGEYSYGMISLSADGVVALYPISGDAGARFDHVRIREGGSPQ